MTTKRKNSPISQEMMIVGAIIAIVVIAVAAFIGIQVVGNNTTATLNYDTIDKGRTEDGAFILGDPDAAVTIVAFEDFLCPHCQNYQPEIHEFFETYVATGKANFEFRMLPISQMSATSFGLAECADELQPGSFWQAHDTLFSIASTSRFNEGSPRDFAQQMDMNYIDLLDCMKDADQYLIDGAYANQFSEITGTPSVGWRLNDGELRLDEISRRPSVRELGALIDKYSVASQ